eukprot:4923890-Prymnesium_polylepis.2
MNSGETVRSGCELWPDWSLCARYVRAIAIALIAWLMDGGPTHCSVGQSTAARACAAIWHATSREFVWPPILVVLLPRCTRSQKSAAQHGGSSQQQQQRASKGPRAPPRHPS